MPSIRISKVITLLFHQSISLQKEHIVFHLILMKNTLFGHKMCLIIDRFQLIHLFNQCSKFDCDVLFYSKIIIHEDNG